MGGMAPGYRLLAAEGQRPLWEFPSLLITWLKRVPFSILEFMCCLKEKLELIWIPREMVLSECPRPKVTLESFAGSQERWCLFAVSSKISVILFVMSLC